MTPLVLLDHTVDHLESGFVLLRVTHHGLVSLVHLRLQVFSFFKALVAFIRDELLHHSKLVFSKLCLSLLLLLDRLFFICFLLIGDSRTRFLGLRSFCLVFGFDFSLAFPFCLPLKSTKSQTNSRLGFSREKKRVQSSEMVLTPCGQSRSEPRVRHSSLGQVWLH